MPTKRDFKRKSGFRDSRLIIIAAEGEQTERLYFEGLKSCYQNPRVHIEILEHIYPSSDPAKVIRSLDRFCSNYNLRKGHDQLWLVIDVDRWGNQKLSEVSTQCDQKNYQLSVSNPSFEIWLLFHVKALEDYSPEMLAELLENKKDGNRTRLEQELLNLLGSYNKTNPDMEYFAGHVNLAIQNARIADIEPETRWPNHLGSRVYLLAMEIVPGNNG